MNTRHLPLSLAILLAGSIASTTASAADPAVRTAAVDAMARATAFMRTKIAVQGGYLWYYSLDLTQREGEGKATASQIWVQPPGTPAVGMAFLKAYEATANQTYLDAARDAAMALVWGQLESGGWDYLIDFNDKQSKTWYYRRDREAGQASRDGRRNTSTFDDNTSQSALRLLMQVDKATNFKDKEIRNAVDYALTHFLKVQYPHGAWPQRFAGPPDPAKFPVCKARYPETWSRTYPKASYGGFYTFNDNAVQDVISTMLDAYEIYKKDEYLAAANRAGDFILMAQMPEPQPVWAQQYNENMEPAWARKFEPPSVVSGESIGVIESLLELYQATGQKKYLQTLPAAFEWFKRSKLPNGKMARFYELKTNKPLYFTKDYQLVYSDADTPTHYCFQADWDTGPVERRYQEMLKKDRATYQAEQAHAEHKAHASESYEKQVRKIVKALDDQGRWIEKDRISCGLFNHNLTVLANYLAATRD